MFEGVAGGASRAFSEGHETELYKINKVRGDGQPRWKKEQQRKKGSDSQVKNDPHRHIRGLANTNTPCRCQVQALGNPAPIRRRNGGGSEVQVRTSMGNMETSSKPIFKSKYLKAIPWSRSLANTENETSKEDCDDHHENDQGRDYPYHQERGRTFLRLMPESGLQN